MDGHLIRVETEIKKNIIQNLIPNIYHREHFTTFLNLPSKLLMENNL